MMIHSGRWWAPSQISNRSLTTRLIMSPELTRSKYEKQKRSYWSNRSSRILDSMRAPMMWPWAATKYLQPVRTRYMTMRPAATKASDPMMACGPSANRPPVRERRMMGKARSMPARISAQTVSAMNRWRCGP